MTIADAMRAVADEYDAECIRTKSDAGYQQLLENMMDREYEEIDEELPNYAAAIFQAMVWQEPVLDPRIYQAMRMAFRMGMRTQRKLTRPEEATTSFWRSDQVRT